VWEVRIGAGAGRETYIEERPELPQKFPFLLIQGETLESGRPGFVVLRETDKSVNGRREVQAALDHLCNGVPSGGD
jgi:hypothetical protein